MRRTAVAVCLLFLATTLAAATFELPSDRQLLDRADVVVVATVLGAQGREDSDRMIYTDHRLRVEQVLKGNAALELVVSEAGGFANGRGVAIAGTAHYEPGTRVLAFLRQRDDGTYYTAYMALGKYRFAGERLVRDAHGIEAMSGHAAEARDAQAFLSAIRTGELERAPIVTSIVASNGEPEPRTDAQPPQAYVFSGGVPVRPIRWAGCDTACLIGFFRSPTAQAGVTFVDTHIEAAMDAWNSDPNSHVTMGLGGTTFATVPADEPTDENSIIMNYGGPLPPFCDGSLGCAVVRFGLTHTFKGQTWYSVEESDIVILAGSRTNLQFETILGHELGHALAFIDTNQNALMNASLNLARGAVLGTWDLEALAQVYGEGVPCAPVNITGTSGGGTVPFNGTANLSVSLTGDGPFTYQWYEGPTGTTTTPVGTSATFVTPPITTTKQYWVKVSNACPSSKNSATITVTPESCDEPTITSEPQSRRINPGTTTSMNVVATGTTPLTFRWYRANTVGDTSVQVGTQPSFTTPVLNATTSYWARVSNNCGHDDTQLITVTVSAECVKPAITSQSPNVTLQQGDGATISVTASGDAPFTYQWYEGDAPDETKPVAGATSQSFPAGPFANAGTFKFWAKVTNACGSANSPTITISVACPPIGLPLASAPAIVHYTTGYTISWSGNPTVSSFEVQEATNAGFTENVKTFTVSGALSRSIAPHLEIAADTRFFYRVRAISVCTSQPTQWSNTVTTVVTRPLPPTSEQFTFSVPVGTTQSFTQELLIPGFGDTATNNDTFAIVIDVPWLTVFPASGALSAGGTTVQLTISPATLEVGTTTGTIQITRTNAAAAKKGIATHDGSSNVSLPLSLSLVTPVTPEPREGNPPPGTLIIPAVAHAQGIGSPFRSDVRIVNVSFTDIDYEISYTPSQTDGTQLGKKTSVTIRAGDVLALDDIVAAWYGAGMLGEDGVGTIEIRPLNAASPLDTFASSRTYALTGGGTLGQFIPALRLPQFIGNFAQDTLSRISLQQIANSPDYRTNIGFVEGSGVPVSFVARLVDGNNNLLGTINRDLPAFGHLQRSVVDLFGNANLSDGRVEVEVTSANGKVSAYASLLNNKTNDPLLIFPVQPARTTAGRYVLAGIAEFDAGDRNFHSDMRVYNAGNAAVTATFWYYDRGQTSPHQGAPPAQRTIQPGQVVAINDVLPTLWPGLIGGGSVVITAPEGSSLVTTAQTYSRQPDGGTKGQFIPGVTFREAIGFGERALEVLQLEESAQYRSNVGFVEVTGAPAVIEVTAFEPDTKASVVTSIPLQANEYRQFDRILASMGLGTVYNGRVSVKVIHGAGRVYAYGSTIDYRTEDPTYVPAQ